jgi:aldehyde:ferredoxin oxidoreductase
MDCNIQSLLNTDESVCLLERELNVSNGFTKQDDDLPGRFFKDKGFDDGKIEITPVNR